MTTPAFVFSPLDAEKAALSKEQREIGEDDDGEVREPSGFHLRRGRDVDLASQSARRLMTHEAPGAHARDEVGISDATAGRDHGRHWCLAQRVVEALMEAQSRTLRSRSDVPV